MFQVLYCSSRVGSVMGVAHTEALRLGHARADTLHVLYAMTSNDLGVMMSTQMLKSMEIDTQETGMREALVQAMASNAADLSQALQVYTPAVIRALNFAYQESALRESKTGVDTGDLLSGLLLSGADGDTISAGMFLRERGVTAKYARRVRAGIPPCDEGIMCFLDSVGMPMEMT